MGPPWRSKIFYLKKIHQIWLKFGGYRGAKKNKQIPFDWQGMRENHGTNSFFFSYRETFRTLQVV